MQTFADEIRETLRLFPGMTDREVMDYLRGRDKKQNQAHQECRLLERHGHIIRKHREDGRIGNFLAVAEPSEGRDASLRATQQPTSSEAVPRTARKPHSETVFLVSCVSRKQQSPAAAKDLYLSDFFHKARRFVEAQNARWFILSAKHGLLSPDEVVAPYEQTLNKMGAAARREWANRVLEQIAERMPEAEHVIFLAGERYREYLIQPLVDRGIHVEAPMQGLKIGEQLSWLSRHAEQ